MCHGGLAKPRRQFGGELVPGESSADRLVAAQSRRVAINSVHHCYLVESRGSTETFASQAPRHSSEADAAGGRGEEEVEGEKKKREGPPTWSSSSLAASSPSSWPSASPLRPSWSRWRRNCPSRCPQCTSSKRDAPEVDKRNAFKTWQRK